MSSSHTSLARSKMSEKFGTCTFAKHLHSHLIDDQSVVGRGKSADWFRQNVEIKILWSASTISLQKTAKTRNCRLCAMERVSIGHFISDRRLSKKLVNSKVDLFGHCSCKTRFLRFVASKEGGSDEA